MPPVLSEELKVKIRHHMGYIGVQEAATFAIGVPAAIQTEFMIESAMNKLLASSLDRLRIIVDRLDYIEQQMEENQELVAVNQVDTIQVRPNEFEELIKRYKYQQGALGNLMGVPPNPYDMRFGGAVGGSAANVRVLQ